MKVQDIIKMLEADGWYLVRTKGSHRQYKHPSKPVFDTPQQVGASKSGCHNLLWSFAGDRAPKTFKCRKQAKPGRVTIAGHPNDDLAPGTLNSILKQAQLKEPKRRK